MSTQSPTPPHRRLDEAIQQRRLELRVPWKAIAGQAGVSPEALRAIRRGDYRPSALTARGIEDALQWPHGKVFELLEETAPTEDSVAGSGQAVDSQVQMDRIRLLLAEYRRLVDEIIEELPDRKRASVGAAANLTATLVEDSTDTDQSM